MSDVTLDFGKKLREARRSAGLTQAQVARRMRIHQSYVSRVERGLENPTLESCLNFATAVGYGFEPSRGFVPLNELDPDLGDLPLS